MRDRGVSEVIAFILVFSIVITSVGLLYTAGFGSILQIQESETDGSAERAFGASAIALEDIQRGRGSQRAVDLELSGRTLSIDHSDTLTASIGGSSETASGTLRYGPGEDTEIGYESGAIVRDDGEDAQLVSRAPQFRCTPEHAVVTLVTITGPSNSVSTDGAIRVTASGPDPRESTLEVAETGGTTVTIDYSNSEYSAAWSQYFDRSTNEWSDTGGTAECSVSGTAYIRHVPITLEYQGVG